MAASKRAAPLDIRQHGGELFQGFWNALLAANGEPITAAEEGALNTPAAADDEDKSPDGNPALATCVRCRQTFVIHRNIGRWRCRFHPQPDTIVGDFSGGTPDEYPCCGLSFTKAQLYARWRGVGASNVQPEHYAGCVRLDHSVGPDEPLSLFGLLKRYSAAVRPSYELQSAAVIAEMRNHRELVQLVTRTMSPLTTPFASRWLSTPVAGREWLEGLLRHSSEEEGNSSDSESMDVEGAEAPVTLPVLVKKLMLNIWAQSLMDPLFHACLARGDVGKLGREAIEFMYSEAIQNLFRALLAETEEIISSVARRTAASSNVAMIVQKEVTALEALAERIVEAYPLQPAQAIYIRVAAGLESIEEERVARVVVLVLEKLYTREAEDIPLIPLYAIRRVDERQDDSLLHVVHLMNSSLRHWTPESLKKL